MPIKVTYGPSPAVVGAAGYAAGMANRKKRYQDLVIPLLRDEANRRYNFFERNQERAFRQNQFDIGRQDDLEREKRQNLLKQDWWNRKIARDDVVYGRNKADAENDRTLRWSREDDQRTEDQELQAEEQTAAARAEAVEKLAKGEIDQGQFDDFMKQIEEKGRLYRALPPRPTASDRRDTMGRQYFKKRWDQGLNNAPIIFDEKGPRLMEGVKPDDLSPEVRGLLGLGQDQPKGISPEKIYERAVELFKIADPDTGERKYKTFEDAVAAAQKAAKLFEQGGTQDDVPQPKPSLTPDQKRGIRGWVDQPVMTRGDLPAGQPSPPPAASQPAQQAAAPQQPQPAAAAQPVAAQQAAQAAPPTQPVGPSDPDFKWGTAVPIETPAQPVGAPEPGAKPASQDQGSRDNNIYKDTQGTLAMMNDEGDLEVIEIGEDNSITPTGKMYSGDQNMTVAGTVERKEEPKDQGKPAAVIQAAAFLQMMQADPSKIPANLEKIRKATEVLERYGSQ